MGRLLKLLAFVHDEGIAVRALEGNNILLELEQHFTVVFDWSSSQTHQSGVPKDLRKNDIAGAAKAVFKAIGGNPESGEIVTPPGDERRYTEFLWNLATRREASAERAHEQFYKLIRELFGREFHEFTTLPL